MHKGQHRFVMCVWVFACAWVCAWKRLFEVASHYLKQLYKQWAYTLKQQNKQIVMKVVARGHIVAAALWIRWILSTADKFEFAQVLPFPRKCLFSWEILAASNTVTVPWALRIHTQTTCISVDLVVFCGTDACDPATDRHTDTPRYTCSSRPHPMLCSVMRPKSCSAARRPARRYLCWYMYIIYVWRRGYEHFLDFQTFYKPNTTPSSNTTLSGGYT